MGRKFKFILDSGEMQAWIKRQMRCITTPKTTDNKSAAGNSAQAKTQAVALGASEHSGKLFKSKIGANGFEPSTSCSQGKA